MPEGIGGGTFMEHSEVLPLFPLEAVLFPQSQMPLHIFEERYKRLIAECLPGGLPFGVNRKEDEQIEPVGCTAVVRDVLKRYPDGRMDIVVEGRRRYSLLGMVDTPTPYRSGRIRWYDDVSEEADDGLIRRAVELHNRFAALVFRGSVKPVELSDVRRTRSFHLVQKSGMVLAQRQTLLSMTAENERLEFLVRHLEEIVPVAESRSKAEELARNDGYLQE
ncbi:MAG: hypothetical protein F9K22_11935 [Bacteroidetes bacterium]|nr:MAG: hypothetical protein F9K22_11935 [Bacteroidota bacterium]